MDSLPKRHSLALLMPLLLVASLVVPVMPVAAQSEQVIGSPNITASVQDNHIQASEQTQIAVTLSNTGQVRRSGPAQFVDRVSTARNVQVSIDDARIDAPINVKTGTVTLGALQDGGVQQAAFDIETGKTLDPGTYTVPVRVTYSYTQYVNYDQTQSGYSNIEYVDGTRTTTIDVKLVVEQTPQFSLSPTATDQLTAGGSDYYNFSVTNDGSQRAHDISVHLTSQSPSVQFGSTQPRSEASVFIPSLAPGETHTASVRVTTTDSSTAGQYPIHATVEYETPNGISGTSDPITVSGEVKAEQQFALENVISGLRVGTEGNVTATLTNRGPNPANDAVITLQAPATGIEPQRTEFALGDLEAGAGETIRFPVTVTDSADAGPYQFAYSVSYEDRNGNDQQSNTLNTRIQIAEQRDVFDVTGVNTSLQVGSSDTLELQLTNNGDATLRNINAKAFVDDPLSASSDEAFVPSLEPGESTTIVFEVSATGGAVAQPRPLELDFQYQEPDGDTVLSDTYQVPVTLTPAAAGGLPMTIIGVVVVIVLIGAGLIYRRR